MENKKVINSRIGTSQIALVSAELALALWVIFRFSLDPAPLLESAVFLAIPLFAIHALIPLHWRRPFLLLATFGLTFSILGPAAFAIAVVTGFGLIGICHLPIAYRWRLLFIAAVAGGAASAYVSSDRNSGNAYLPYAVPFLGAVFMFRLVIYLYDIRHEKPGTVTFVERVGYFFLLPAPLFPFFPTLDYKVYLRCFYARPSFEIYQTGMLWISRGIVHLILYRFIYHFFSPPAEHVTDLGGVMAYCLSGYLIYLRVSGVFHIISGLLRLFGYDLPETHRLYFFASGFSDYWRRINIYWKDFMAKVFFFPTFSVLRGTRLGRATKVAVATVAVFAATTVLHAYQTFWLRGDATIHETDYWFWGILGFLVIVNNLLDDRKAGKPQAAGINRSTKKEWDFKSALGLSFRVLGMFLLLCVLWALWSSQTVANFLDVMSQAKNATPTHFGILFGFCAVAIVLGVLGQWFAHRGFHFFEERPRPVRSMATTVFPLLVLTGLWENHAANGLTGDFGEKFEIVHTDQPNERDQIQMERSYYEVLLGAGGEAANFGASEEEHAKNMDNPDVRGGLYRKSYGPAIAWDAQWTTNSWGMRDEYYPQKKPDGIYRIAISGASYVAGRGVADGQTFESVAEEALNAGGKRFEILNFACSDTGTLQRLADLEIRILDFKPDAFYLVCHNGEADRNLRKLADIVSSGDHELTYPFIEDIVAKAGVRTGDDRDAVIRALMPYSEELLAWCYSRISEVCRGHEITPVWIYLPLTLTHNRISLAEKGRQFPKAEGIHTVILDELYSGYDIEKIVISETDSHPNALGHRLIARRLVEKMKAERVELAISKEIDGLETPALAEK